MRNGWGNWKRRFAGESKNYVGAIRIQIALEEINKGKIKFMNLFLFGKYFTRGSGSFTWNWETPLVLLVPLQSNNVKHGHIEVEVCKPNLVHKNKASWHRYMATITRYFLQALTREHTEVTMLRTSLFLSVNKLQKADLNQNGNFTRNLYTVATVKCKKLSNVKWFPIVYLWQFWTSAQGSTRKGSLVPGPTPKSPSRLVPFTSLEKSNVNEHHHHHHRCHYSTAFLPRKPFFGRVPKLSQSTRFIICHLQLSQAKISVSKESLISILLCIFGAFSPSSPFHRMAGDRG